MAVKRERDEVRLIDFLKGKSRLAGEMNLRFLKLSGPYQDTYLASDEYRSSTYYNT